MCHPAFPNAVETALWRWIWGARWQLTRFALDNYALYGRGLTLIEMPGVLDPTSDAGSFIPDQNLAFHTLEALRAMKPSRKVSHGHLRDWIGLTQLYNPATQWVHAVVAESVPTSVSIGPLITQASEARHAFSKALTIRPLPLEVVRRAARVYRDELLACGSTQHEIEAAGRQEMRGYRRCFTQYDDAPVLGRQVAGAIAEGFGLEPSGDGDQGEPPQTDE